MRIHNLGPLVVEFADRSVSLSVRQAALLARLTISLRSWITPDELSAAVWGPDVATTTSQLDNQLWRLRKVLEPSRGRAAASILVHSTAGYRLAVSPEDVDSVRFEQLVDDLDAAAPAPLELLRRIDVALSLWRGRPFGPLVDLPDAGAAVTRLEELHTQLSTRRIATLVAAGQPERALADLEPLLAAAPYREPLWAQRIRILAGLGRTEEALATHRRIAGVLRDELGLDPGTELRELQSRLLSGEQLGTPSPRDSETTLGPAPDEPAPQRRPSAPHLPRGANRLVGRSLDVQRLVALVATQSLVTVVGPGGCGKTRLAIEVAATASGDHIDGVWFVDLTSATDPARVVDVVLSALQIGSAGTRDPLRVLTDYLDSVQLLIVLDNCEHVLEGAAECVDAIAASGGRSVVLATSREPLSVDGEVVWTLAPLSMVSDDEAAARGDGDPTNSTPPPESQSRPQLSAAAELFWERARLLTPDLELEPDGIGLIERICQAVDGLPLAIELAAARVRSFGLTEIADQVTSDPTGLSRIGRPRDDHHSTLYDAIDWSYQLLSPTEQMMHRSLSVLASPFPLAAAAAVAPPQTDPADLVTRLVHRSLLAPDARVGRRTAFTQLATIQAHARATLTSTSGAGTQETQARDHWLHSLLRRRPRLGHPAESIWVEDVDSAYPALRRGMNEALAASDDPSWLTLGSGLAYFWFLRTRLIEGDRWLETALSRWVDGLNPVDAARARLEAAWIQLMRGRPDLAGPRLAASVPVLTDPDDENLVGNAEMLIGLAGAGWMASRLDLVRQLAPPIRTLALRSGDADLDVLASVVECLSRTDQLRGDEMAAEAERIYAVAQPLGNRWAVWWMCSTGAIAEQQLHSPARGRRWASRLMEVQLEYGSSPIPLEVFANFAAMDGDLPRAAQTYLVSRLESQRAGMPWPIMPITPELYERTRRELGDRVFEQAEREARQADPDTLLISLSGLINPG